MGTVVLTHPDRVYWRDAGITKEQLAKYYKKIWQRMRPHVAGRVLALVRCPEGAEGQCFFQKHARMGIPTEFLHLVQEKGEKIISIDQLDGLIALVQGGVLEVHARGSQVDDRERANRLVFDLDPGPGTDFKDVIDTAREVRARLRRVKLKSFVKTTGGKGLHVVVPIRPTPWAVAKTFAHTVAASMAKDEPARYTANPIKARRHHRVFIDYLRNSREATAIVPYSTRARAGRAGGGAVVLGRTVLAQGRQPVHGEKYFAAVVEAGRGPVGGHGAHQTGAAEAQIRSHGTVEPACALMRTGPSAFGGALCIGKPPNTSIAPTRMQRQASPRGFPNSPS